MRSIKETNIQYKSSVPAGMSVSSAFEEFPMSEHSRLYQVRRSNIVRRPASTFHQASPAFEASRPLPAGYGHGFQSLAIFPKLEVNAPGDRYEREADQSAAEVVTRIADVSRPSAQRMPSIQRAPADGGLEVEPHMEQQIEGARGGGSSLPDAVRGPMEGAFGADFSGVRVHTDGPSDALSRSLQARAFTTGQDIFFRSGEYAPGSSQGQSLLAHELTHTVQQSGVQRKILQRDLAESIPTSTGVFEMGMIAQQGALATPATPSGLKGTIRFEPGQNAPYSNQIGLIQIVKLTDDGDANIDPASMPAGRGASLRTTEDKDAGVDGGFFTDVLHGPLPRVPTGTPAQGSALPPQYAFGPGGSPANPVHNGFPTNTGGAPGQIFGFKRSETDLKGAELFDFPGTASSAAKLNFEFETVAKGEDVMVVYGGVKWGFQLRGGKVENEHVSVEDNASATFNAALDKHRDFYVHEPVTFYFDFDSDKLNDDEIAKIDTFLDYLRRFPDVQLQLNGFADLVGGASAYNVGLSNRRESDVQKLLQMEGVDAARIKVNAGQGVSTHATTDATTAQNDEANRRGNRRVELTFVHVPGSGGSAAGGAAAGGGAAGGGGAP